MIAPRNAPVAQLDRVLPSEGRGRGFESRLVRHINQVVTSALSISLSAQDSSVTALDKKGLRSYA